MALTCIRLASVSTGGTYSNVSSRPGEGEHSRSFVVETIALDIDHGAGRSGRVRRRDGSLYRSGRDRRLAVEWCASRRASLKKTHWFCDLGNAYERLQQVFKVVVRQPMVKSL